MGKAKKGDGNEVPESSGILASLDAWDKRVSYAFYLGNSSLAPVAIPICKALEYVNDCVSQSSPSAVTNSYPLRCHPSCAACTCIWLCSAA